MLRGALNRGTVSHNDMYGDLTNTATVYTEGHLQPGDTIRIP